jgi:hypothetical protein
MVMVSDCKGGDSVEARPAEVSRTPCAVRKPARNRCALGSRGEAAGLPPVARADVLAQLPAHREERIGEREVRVHVIVLGDQQVLGDRNLDADVEFVAAAVVPMWDLDGDRAARDACTGGFEAREPVTSGGFESGTASEVASFEDEHGVPVVHRTGHASLEPRRRAMAHRLLRRRG